MPSLQSLKRRAQGIRLEKETLESQDLRSLSAPMSNLTDVRFQECQMGLADFTGATLTDVAFSGSPLYASRFIGATIINSRFVGCDLEQASFAGAVLRRVSFRSCRMSYSTFAGATMKIAVFDDDNLHGADLDFIEGTNVDFQACNLWGVRAAMACAFWSSRFDDDSCNRFAALLARVHPNKRSADALKAVAGDYTFRAVERLMRPREKEEADVQLVPA